MVELSNRPRTGRRKISHGTQVATRERLATEPHHSSRPTVRKGTEVTEQAERAAVELLCSADLRARGLADDVPYSDLADKALVFVWRATDWLLDLIDDHLEAASLLLSGWLPESWGRL